MRIKTIFPIFSLAFLLAFAPSEAGEAKTTGEEAAVRGQSAAFADAFNRRDAKGLAALWTENAEYVNPETGEKLEGRDEIEEQYQSSFQEKKGGTIKIMIEKIAFPSSDRAVEAGTATVTRSSDGSERTAYRAFYTKQGGEWLLTEVREVEFDPAPKQNEHLKQLEWLVGDWIDEDKDTKIETVGKWGRHENFLTQHFTVAIEGQLELEGRQVIGWDPIDEMIRSWVFDSDGGFGEGVWNKEGNTWTVETSQTLADGRRASAINVYTPKGQNSYTWESTGREVGGELLPNIEPVTVKRKEG